jgi:hypothetical protein
VRRVLGCWGYHLLVLALAPGLASDHGCDLRCSGLAPVWRDVPLARFRGCWPPGGVLPLALVKGRVTWTV